MKYNTLVQFLLLVASISLVKALRGGVREAEQQSERSSIAEVGDTEYEEYDEEMMSTDVDSLLPLFDEGEDDNESYNNEHRHLKGGGKGGGGKGGRGGGKGGRGGFKGGRGGGKGGRGGFKGGRGGFKGGRGGFKGGRGGFKGGRGGFKGGRGGFKGGRGGFKGGRGGVKVVGFKGGRGGFKGGRGGFKGGRTVGGRTSRGRGRTYNTYSSGGFYSF